jgi:hypothetical protein
MYMTKLEEYHMTEEIQNVEKERANVKTEIILATEESLGRKRCRGTKVYRNWYTVKGCISKVA